jgi:hypothetical protein
MLLVTPTESSQGALLQEIGVGMLQIEDHRDEWKP